MKQLVLCTHSSSNVLLLPVMFMTKGHRVFDTSRYPWLCFHPQCPTPLRPSPQPSPTPTPSPLATRVWTRRHVRSAVRAVSTATEPGACRAASVRAVWTTRSSGSVFISFTVVLLNPSLISLMVSVNFKHHVYLLYS